MGWGRFRRVLTSALLAVSCSAGLAQAKELAAVSASIAVQDLPAAGQETFARIRKQGPFAFDKDGSVFANRERLLPPHTRGYYREYTVKTPQSGDRGARRIVCGGPVAAPDACYYTADHYASFRQIVP